MDILAQIEKLRKERGWTYYKLAKKANVPQSTLANLFKRNNWPTLPTLDAICNAFGISLAQFFSDNMEYSLTDDQKELLKEWSLLSDHQKEKVKIYIHGLLDGSL